MAMALRRQASDARINADLVMAVSFACEEGQAAALHGPERLRSAAKAVGPTRLPRLAPCFDSLRSYEHPVLRGPEHFLNGANLRQTNCPGKVRHNPIAEIDSDMRPPCAVRIVEQQKIQRLESADCVAEFLIFPQFAGPEKGHVNTEMPEQGIGPQLAVRSLADVELRGPRVPIAVVGYAPELGWDFKRHGGVFFHRTLQLSSRGRAE
jgi:hypothetical protein